MFPFDDAIMWGKELLRHKTNQTADDMYHKLPHNISDSLIGNQIFLQDKKRARFC